jgi:quercetin dioxygenase-like cupin family protein
MATSILALFLLVAGALQDLPHAFPREDAKQLIDNNRVTVWEATWPKGKVTPLHRHQYDFIGIDLADSVVRVTTQDGNSQYVAIKVGNVQFREKGMTHREEGTSDSPRHAILIDLKDVSMPPTPNTTRFPTAFPRENARKVLENSRLIVWDYTWTPGKPTPMHFHDKDVVVVYMENGEVKSTTPDGKADINPISFGMTRFNLRDRTHSEELVKGRARAIIVELK